MAVGRQMIPLQGLDVDATTRFQLRRVEGQVSSKLSKCIDSRPLYACFADKNTVEKMYRNAYDPPRYIC